MQEFKQYLNPIYKEVDKIIDYTDLKELSDLEKEEYPNLQKVAVIKAEVVAKLLPRLDKLEEELEHQISLIEAEGDLDEKKNAKKIYNQILDQIEKLVRRINRELILLDSPYFGKILFEPQDSRSTKPLELYIGKSGLIDDKTHKPLITDWRSPIANIYYENSGPTNNVSFYAPVGERKGDLKQKRQFQISRARINSIYDAKSGNVAADEFLLKQLNDRLGKKLQDIVSTIQKLQNSIIREDINLPMIIQGVAGSGKTTILLHRLAYLFYGHKEEISPKNSLIIAPNQMFTDYVSDVLPSLGVESVETLTYLFWAKSVLSWDDTYTVSPEKEDLDIKEYKGSKEFLGVLEEYFTVYEQNLLDNIPYSRKDIITRRYYKLKEEFPNIDMLERLDLATDYAFAKKQFQDHQTGFYDATHDTDLSIKKGIYEYFRRNTNIYTLYKGLFRSKLVTSETSTYTLRGLTQRGKVRHYRIEDLAPMVYLQLKISGTKMFQKDCVVVDEGQDVSFIQIATLAMVAKNSNITIAGDIAQSIIPPFYIRDWNDVISLLEDITETDVKYYQLQKCYRTTIEVVDFANNILTKWFPESYKLPEGVLRHGEDVHRIGIRDSFKNCSKNELRDFVRTVREEFEKGSATCTLLCRDKEHAKEVYNVVKEYEELIGRRVISFEKRDYNTGLLVMPIENAKGLEFDTTFIMDLNKNFYNTEELDIKLLYVALTRALHRVYIVTKKEDHLYNDLFTS